VNNLPIISREELELAVERELCKRSLSYFIEKAWPHIDPAPYVWNWHIDAVSAGLEAIAKEHINRLYINIPPGHLKSLQVSVFYNAWLWGPFGRPDKSVLSTSHSMSFSSRDTRRTRELIMSEWFQKLWPITLKTDQDSKTDFGNTKMGQRQAKAFGNLTGGRGNILIIDDPISANDALSEVARENVKLIFKESVPTRLNNLEKDAIIIIAQRLHERDIIGVIKELGLSYESIVIPTEYTGNKIINQKLSIIDPRKEVGELLFPTLFPRDQIEQLKKSLGPFAFSAQHQQEAVPRSDGFFDMNTLEATRYDAIDMPRRSDLNVYITSDHAPSGTGDNNVVRVWGVDSRNHKWLLDSFVDKCDMSQAMGITTDDTGRMAIDNRGALALIQKWKPLYWFPEHDNNWRSIEPTVKMAMNALPNAFCRIRPLPTTGSKEQKATAYDSAIRMGMIHLPRTAEGDATVNEYRTFPVGEYDDRVDADGAICRAESAHPGTIQLPAPPSKRNQDYTDSFQEELEDHQGGFFS